MDNVGFDNVCMYGRFVPEFILIGVVKAATTSFAANLRQSNGIIFPSRCPDGEPGLCEHGTDKEGHFFDMYRGLGPYYMSESFPKCRHDVRMVATDESPRYMLDRNVPATIANWYGTLQLRLKFIILLRDPVARFQSDYYQAKKADWCVDYRYYSFKEIVKSILNSNTWNHYTGGFFGCSDRLEASLYPDAVRRWFTVFPSKQFAIVPFLFLVDSGTHGRSNKSVVQSVWYSLGVEPGANVDIFHYNSYPHPTLETDLGVNVTKTFRDLLWKYYGPQHLATVFVQHPGARLFGYRGGLNDVNAMTRWLENNW